jgi:hypothetical protein
MDLDMNTLYIVTPVYEDNEASTRLFLELATAFNDKRNNVCIVAVDDGSVCQPVDIENMRVLVVLSLSYGVMLVISVLLRSVWGMCLNMLSLKSR